MLRRTRWMTLVHMSAFLWMSASSLRAGAAPSGAPLTVAVTLSDLAPIVRAVGGDLVAPLVVMPSGADPHSVSLSADIVQKVGRADLIVFANSGFLSFEKQLRESLPRMPSVDWPDYEARGARLLDFPGMPQNPHGFWLDFDNARAIAGAVADALIQRGAPAEVISSNLHRFVAEIDAARRSIRALAGQTGLAGDTLILAVPGVAYVVHNVGAVVGDILLAEGGGFVGAARIEHIARRLREGHARAIVCPVSMKGAKPGQAARQLAQDTGSRVIYVRFLSGDAEHASYLAQTYYNAAVLMQAAHALSSGASGSRMSYLVTIVVLAAIAAAEAVLLMRRRETEAYEHGNFEG